MQFWSRRRARPLAIALLLAPALAACGLPVERGSLTIPPAVYVANGADGTVTRLDGLSSTHTGAPRAAGEAPWQIAAEPGGAMLVLSVAARLSGQLTHVAREGVVPKTRTVPLGDGEEVLPFLTQLTGVEGGSARAVVSFKPKAAHGPQLALVDIVSGTIRSTFTVGNENDRVLAMALDDTTPAPVVYVSLWNDWIESAPGINFGRRWQSGRITALDARTGAVLSTVPVGGVPAQLALTPGRAERTRQLFAVLVNTGAWAENSPTAQGPTHHLVSFDLDSLTPTRVLALTEPLGQLSIAPDARTAYALVEPAQTGIVVHLDLDTGTSRRLARLPALAVGIAISGDRLYVAEPARNVVWVVDRKRGLILRSVPVGNGPIGVASLGSTA